MQRGVSRTVIRVGDISRLNRLTVDRLAWWLDEQLRCSTAALRSHGVPSGPQWALSMAADEAAARIHPGDLG